LLRYLREKLHLSGTKLGCAEGGCGACTVMISRFDRVAKVIKHFAVNACLMPVCALHGLAVTTVEGIGNTRDRLHPVQERIAKAHGSQCGFCTPGIVMSMYTLLRNSKKPNMKDMESALQGNLCRCTGYRPIIDGFKTFTEEFQCGMGENCCRVKNNANLIDDKLFEPSKFVPYDPSQEPIFPPELKLTDAYDHENLHFENARGIIWSRPTKLSELLTLKSENPSAKIIAGNTEIGIEVKLKQNEYKFLINPSQVRELNNIAIRADGIEFGAAISLTKVRDVLRKQIEILKEHETRIFRAIDEMMNYFSSQQTRNVASMAGSIMTGTPISDLNPIFLAATVEIVVVSATSGKRKIKMNENFFTGYRQNVVKGDEVLLSIFIPRTTSNQFFLAYKQAKRRDDDIAIVNAAFNFKLTDDIIDDVRMAFGGVAPTTIMALKTAESMKGHKWNREVVEIVNKNLIEEIPLSFDAPGGTVAYRRSLTLSLFFKAFLHISQQLERLMGLNLLDDRDQSGVESFKSLPPRSTQLFEKVLNNQPPSDPIHRPEIHVSAFKQATGEALYCDDIPKHENELYLALVLSTKAHAKIISVDASEALQLPGVHIFYSAKDIDVTKNNSGPMFRDEELFIGDVVTSHGQLIGAIVAVNQVTAQRAARLVKIEYEDLTPIIVTLEDAIEQKSFFHGYPKEYLSGNYTEAFEKADHVTEGEVRTGGQEHFYLEMQSVIAIPRDADELELFASTQQPCDQQRRVAEFLGIPQHKVVCKTKRIGGNLIKIWPF
jgi:xanthine dehydrogenase/oxidase